jgi:hypothetical protein
MFSIRVVELILHWLMAQVIFDGCVTVTAKRISTIC